MATRATEAFVKQITDELQGNDVALMALLGVRSIALVIDTTCSMDDELTQVKSKVAELMNRIKNPVYDATPSEWILVPFNDPVIGPAFVTEDPDAFLAAVNSLVAFDGGDCPEPSMSATLLAIRPALPNSTVYVVTDATASDSRMRRLVGSEAKARNTWVKPWLTASWTALTASSRASRSSLGHLQRQLPGRNCGFRCSRLVRRNLRNSEALITASWCFV